MARGFMDVREFKSHKFAVAIESMEGAYPNDPNRSIISLKKRPKGDIPLDCHCGMNA
jgi:hypothetical protein